MKFGKRSPESQKAKGRAQRGWGIGALLKFKPASPFLFPGLRRSAFGEETNDEGVRL